MNCFAIHTDNTIINMNGGNINIIFTDANEYFQPVRTILECAIKEQGTTCIDVDKMPEDDYYKLQAYVDYACAID